MDRKTLVILILVIVLAILAVLIGAMFMNINQNDVVIYNNTIDGVGTFNTTNVTNFTLGDRGNDGQDYIANDSIAQVSITSSSADVQVSISEAERVNDSAEGHTIYKNTATVGEHKGEVRYFSILKDSDNQRYVFISTADYNLTCMMVDSFKFF